MLTKRFKTLLVCAATLAVVAAMWGQGTTNEKPSSPGRYQLLAAAAQGFSANGATTVEQRVFMLDTATGKVWSYIPSGPFTTQSGKPGFTPEMFGRVFIDELEGSIPDQMQKAAEYFEKHPATPVPPKH